MKKLIVFLLLIINVLVSTAQDQQTIFKKMVNDSLAKTLFSEADDSLKLKVNLQLENLIGDFLVKEQSLTFNYDSLQFVKSVQTENGSFRLITWTVPFKSGSFLYSGFIQKIRKNAPIEIIQLQGNLTEPDEKKIYDKNTWPMAVYTRLIVNKNKQGEFYTLIGWMGGREGSSRRVLEVLTFDQNGNPVFGAPIFNSDQKTLKSRVIFEFTDQIPFHLAYEQQRLPGKKKKKGWMIVFNHLSGNSRQSRNPYKVLTPNYDKFDAFIFDGTRWQFTSDIDVRMNEKDIQKYSPPADIGLEPK